MRFKRNAHSAYACLIFSILFLSAHQIQAAKPGSRPAQPNVIIILADDLGYGDIGAFRKMYKGVDDKPEAYKHTPQLDKLAKEGIRFSRAYATCWCAPSRQVLLSGMWVGRKSARENPWVGNRLRKLGYTTGVVGKVHGEYPIQRCFENTDPLSAEFDDGFFFNGGERPSYLKKGDTFPTRVGSKSSEFVAEGGEYITDVFTNHAVDFIKRNQKNPFMLYIAHTSPHYPLQGKPEDMRRLFPEQFGSLSDDEIRATASKKDDKALLAAHFTAMVYGLDRGIGKVIETLEACDIANNTLIIFASDNGAKNGSNYPLDGHKWDGLEGGIRVPMIVWSKKLHESKASGTVCDRMVSLADVAPTVLAAAGCKDNLHTDGMDIIASVTGKQPWPENRRYLITTRCYIFQNTGAMDFGFEYEDNHPLMQYVYISDEAKVVAWNPNKTKNIGVVYRALPNFSAAEEPEKLMKEKTPKNGVLPGSGPGMFLFNEMLDVIKSSEGDIIQTWSCAPASEIADYKWWWE